MKIQRAIMTGGLGLLLCLGVAAQDNGRGPAQDPNGNGNVRPGPGQGAGPGRAGGGGFDGPGRGGFDGPGPGGGGGFNGPGPGGPGGGGFDGPPPVRPRPIGPGATVDAMRAYLDMVDQYSKVAKDPTSAGVAAVMASVDVLRPRGPAGAIEYFKKVLPTVKNEAVARAIKLQLVELYKASNQPDKALDLLEKMMTEAPAGESKH